LTGVDEDPSPLVELDEVEVAVEVEVILLVVGDVVVPGMVDALTAPRTPTLANAATAAPVVRRLSRRNAASRARILSWILLSMAPVLTRPLKRPLEQAETLLRAAELGDIRIHR